MADREVPSGVPSHQMVVKVMLSAVKVPPAYFVTDEDRELQYWIDVGELPQLDEAMGGKRYQYFGASVVEPMEGRTFLAINPFWPVDGVDW